MTMIADFRWRMTLGFAAALALLSACASEPPYFGPLAEGHATGYTDQQIDQNRFRVTYQGNSATPRETVEDFLVLRSAQVASQAGYPYFVFDTRDTRARTAYLSSNFGWPGWGAYHRFGGWYGWGGPPYDWDTYTRPITRYSAYAEIVLLTDAQGKADPRALNAQSVIAHLGPLAAPPPPPPHM
jgi:hypothetical protein